jgi:hypothetical protein
MATGWRRTQSVICSLTTLDEDGTVTVTKAEQEEAYTARKNEEAATAVRAQRDKLLQACDWMAIKAFEAGSAVSAEWATYRQALRDVSAQAGFPKYYCLAYTAGAINGTKRRTRAQPY